MRNAQKSPPTGRTGWQRAAILVLALAASLYTAAFSFAVVNDRRLPEIALAIFPGLVPAASQAADIRLFTAAQATVAQGTDRVSADAIPPSLITGIGVQLDPGTRSAIRMIAEQSLSSSLLAADALRQLAYLERSADRKVAPAVTGRDAPKRFRRPATRRDRVAWQPRRSRGCGSQSRADRFRPARRRDHPADAGRGTATRLSRTDWRSAGRRPPLGQPAGRLVGRQSKFPASAGAAATLPVQRVMARLWSTSSRNKVASAKLFRFTEPMHRLRHALAIWWVRDFRRSTGN